MAQRLTDRFKIGEDVEVYFPQLGRWVPGIVVQFQHPAIWVQTAGAQRWFVTNGRRIRPLHHNDGSPTKLAEPQPTSHNE